MFSLDIGQDTTVINEITTVAPTTTEEEIEETTTIFSQTFNDPRAIQFSSDDNTVSFPEVEDIDEVEDITQAFEITFERRKPDPGEKMHDKL